MKCPCGACPSYAAHMRSISVATKALVAGNKADEKCARDLASYRSLVDQGYEPKACTGAYELARDAKTRYDIEGGHPVDEILK